jgi:cell division protein DivIC
MMKKIIKYLKNKYILSLLIFLIYMLFFDRNDVISQYTYRAKLNKLKNDKKYFTEEIEKIKKDMHELMSNPKSLEKFAREKYLMKKDDEEIFVFVPSESPK